MNTADGRHFAVAFALLVAVNIPISCGEAEGGYSVRNQSVSSVAAVFTDSASIPVWYAIASGKTVYLGTHPTSGYSAAVFNATCQQIFSEPARAGGRILEVSGAEPTLSVSSVAAPTGGNWDPGPQTASDQRASCLQVFNLLWARNDSPAPVVIQVALPGNTLREYLVETVGAWLDGGESRVPGLPIRVKRVADCAMLGEVMAASGTQGVVIAASGSVTVDDADPPEGYRDSLHGPLVSPSTCA